MTPLDEHIRVRLIADAGTPTNLAEFHNTIVLVPPDVRVPAVGVLAGVPGRRRPGTPPVLWEWVMSGPVDRVAQAVDLIPGPGGWTDPAARTTWLGAAHELLAAGVPAGPLNQRLPQLYHAAVANDRAANP